MKTVTIAGWYLSVAVGNLLVILITQANFFKSQVRVDVFVILKLLSNLVIAGTGVFSFCSGHGCGYDGIH